MTRRRARPHLGATARLTAVAGSAATSAVLLHLARFRMPSAARGRFERTNHAGHTVTLLEGPAWVGGALLGAAGATGAAAVSRLTGQATHRSGAATVVVALAAGALGALDDLAGGTSDKGLKGHLAALARGEVTTGAVKVLGLGLTGLLGATLSDAHRLSPARRGTRTGLFGTAVTTRLPTVLQTLLGGAVVAGAANAVNLFDLRPGRALKVTLAAGVPLTVGLTSSLPAAVAVGSSLGVVRHDLAATAMLGDTGANAAGALLGLALVERTGPVGRAVALAGLAALTLASERVSFTRVIEGNSVLRRVDEWGREPR